MIVPDPSFPIFIAAKSTQASCGLFDRLVRYGQLRSSDDAPHACCVLSSSADIDSLDKTIQRKAFVRTCRWITLATIGSCTLTIRDVCGHATRATSRFTNQQSRLARLRFYTLALSQRLKAQE